MNAAVFARKFYGRRAEAEQQFPSQTPHLSFFALLPRRCWLRPLPFFLLPFLL
ncbi:hypothetical protein DWUX_228 [Desulfovibrio diazotrophicus]|nr:hypothetical protein DWUX_228 [Desulfovibrio diazotrophicus]